MHVKIAHVKIEGKEFCLQLVVTDVIIQIASIIYIDIISAERIAECRTGKGSGMNGKLTASHHTLTQTQRDIGFYRDGCLQRYIESQLHSGIFFCIEARTDMELHRFAFARNKNDAHAINR